MDKKEFALHPRVYHALNGYVPANSALLRGLQEFNRYQLGESGMQPLDRSPETGFLLIRSEGVSRPFDNSVTGTDGMVVCSRWYQRAVIFHGEVMRKIETVTYKRAEHESRRISLLELLLGRSPQPVERKYKVEYDPVVMYHENDTPFKLYGFFMFSADNVQEVNRSGAHTDYFLYVEGEELYEQLKQQLTLDPRFMVKIFSTKYPEFAKQRSVGEIKFLKTQQEAKDWNRWLYSEAYQTSNGR